MDYASNRKGRTSPGSLTPSDASQRSPLTLLSQDSGTAVVSLRSVSDYEKISYSKGVTDDGEHPDLLYRAGSANYPWIPPTGRHADRPTKPLRGVYGTPLNPVWSTISPRVCDLVRSVVKTSYSIGPARFVTHAENGEETLGPVVIWVGVCPNSTSANTARNVSHDILGLLEQNGVKGVEVEWHEAVSWKAPGPALLSVAATPPLTSTVVSLLPSECRLLPRSRRRAMRRIHLPQNKDKHGDLGTKVYQGLLRLCHTPGPGLQLCETIQRVAVSIYLLYP